MPEQPVYRFAPSPNGALHKGHAYSALLNFHLAQRANGRFLLRIEDVDGGRARDEYERQIFDDLRWLAIKWETPVLKQSEHMARYGKAIDRLTNMGLLYPCFASRREIRDHSLTKSMPRNPDGVPIYPGLYRDLAATKSARRIMAGDPYTLRLNMKKAIALAHKKSNPIHFREQQKDGYYLAMSEPLQAWGDVVLARREIKTSYSLSVVLDDAFQGVTHIVRGQDLYHATSLHRLLQILLDLPEPLYFHHPLILDKTGRKLSKSDQDVSLKSIRASGISPQDFCAGLPPFLRRG